MNLIDAIKVRKSTRTYAGHLSESQLAYVAEVIDKVPSLPGTTATLRLHHFDTEGSFRPGTYGFIKGAGDFILVAMSDETASMLCAGYMGEDVVLRATQAGLGTCWIGGTFRNADFSQGQKWPDGQTLKAIIPIGTPADSSSVRDRLMRFAVSANSRKPFDRLFFDNGTEKPLDSDNTFAGSLELMRLAPSSTNSQPWRAIVIGKSVFFYSAGKGTLHMIDLGIGLRHFMIGEEYAGHKGEISLGTYGAPDVPGWIPIASYHRM